MASKRDENRYKPRHAWYLADALLLVRELQAACWPLFHHVTLGGGVLNHGYSDKDVDIYVLPNYKPGVVHADIESDVVNAISFAIGSRPLTDMKAKSDTNTETHPHGFIEAGHNSNWVEGGCFAHSLRYEDTKGRTIDVFIVRALPVTNAEHALRAFVQGIAESGTYGDPEGFKAEAQQLLKREAPAAGQGADAVELV